MYKHVFVIETEGKISKTVRDNITDIIATVLYGNHATNFITCSHTNQPAADGYLAVPNATVDGRTKQTEHP